MIGHYSLQILDVLSLRNLAVQGQEPGTRNRIVECGVCSMVVDVVMHVFLNTVFGLLE